jgi:two-component system, cell cycle sensor histidine kinase and response regulator CckA
VPVLERTLLRHFPNGIVLLCDHDLRYVVVDGAELDRTGRRADSMEGRTIHELYPPEVCAQIEPYHRRVLAGERVSYEVTLRDRRYFVQGEPVFDGDTVVYGAFSTQEVTELRTKLGQAEEQFRVLLDNLPGAVVVVVDRSLTVQHVSRPDVDLGWRPGDLVGHDMRRVLADRPETVAQFEAALAGVPTQTMYASLNGSRDYRLHVVPLRRDGAVYGALSVARDVTDRARAKRELHAAKDELESAFVHAPIGIAMVAPDGRWLRVNRALCELLGYTEEELLPATFQQITHPDDLADDLVLVGRVLAGELDSYAMEKRYIAKDGSILHVRLSVSLVRDGDGAPLHFVSQIQDWRGEVRRRELELELAEARRAESLAVLAGGIAHDFNNHLQAVRGYAALALRRVEADSPVRGYLEALEGAAQAATDLSLKMLQYSGRHGLELQPIDLSRLAEDVVRGREVELRLAEGLPPVRGDLEQLKLVPLQLVDNAVEAAGTAVVTTGIDDGYVYLDVFDDGDGMDAETKGRMFEPFFTTKFPGRGLGLAAVDGIVRGHGGRIEVETAPGAGTRVRVLLPAAA